MEESVFNVILTMLKEKQDKCLQTIDEDKFISVGDKIAADNFWFMLDKLIDEIEILEEKYLEVKKEIEDADKNNDGWIPIDENHKKPLSNMFVLVCSNHAIDILKWNNWKEYWEDIWNKKTIGDFIAWRPLPPIYNEKSEKKI